MKFFTIVISFVLFFFNTLPVFSQHTEKSLDSHVHGLSELLIAIEKEVLEIQFVSPAINLVGFEHQAVLSEDINKVKKISNVLKNLNSFFSFSGTNCYEISTNIDVSDLIDLKKDSEKEKNDHLGENNHKHDHTKPSKKDNHSEIIVNYNLSCDNTLSLSSIKVNFFDTFHGTDKIKVMWINQTKQGANTISPKNRIIEFF